MKSIISRNTAKFVLTTLATITFTVAGVKAWNGLTASNGDVLDYTKWNSLVSTVQSGRIPGEVAAFNLASCPTGWTAYTAAAGRTIIGVGNGAGNNTTLWQTLWDKTAPAINTSIPVSTTVPVVWPQLTDGQQTYLTNAAVGSNLKWLYSTTAPVTGSMASISITGGGTAPDNMQPSIALLYCQKN